MGLYDTFPGIEKREDSSKKMTQISTFPIYLVILIIVLLGLAAAAFMFTRKKTS